jgi:hypothetical protein
MNRYELVLGLVIGGVMAAIAVLAFGYVVLVRSPSGTPKSCTLAQLVEHLSDHQIGSRVQYTPDGGAGPFLRNPSGNLVPCAIIDNYLLSIFEMDDEVAARQGARAMLDEFRLASARNKSVPEANTNNIFAWGRFVFLVPDGDTGQQIKELLR